ncbi:MAG: hypothetical protein QHC77_17555 [Stenotrophomonas sp.]|uniref:hypothetical protein n=1 Tax=Stenotrophomonas sp. TaxID=69392 RepID=UPI0029AE7891|nr:hypothetical protein [Stenotrophomonas sp.]MDX3933740.1 hypothetical protein [Stenotrophomonas sp.]
MNPSKEKESIFLFEVKSQTGPVNVIGIPQHSTSPIEVHIGANSTEVASNSDKAQPIRQSDSSENVLKNLIEDNFLFCSTVVKMFDPQSAVTLFEISWLNRAGQTIKSFYRIAIQNRDIVIAEVGSLDEAAGLTKAEVARFNLDLVLRQSPPEATEKLASHAQAAPSARPIQVHRKQHL